ncbi:hypothetical protein WMF38_00935 [Sorangium sp. So ce118]
MLRDFGFVQDAAGPEGLYTAPAPGWRIRAVVIAELPRVRGTVLLRLLGSPRVRRAALRDLAALAEEAWERRVALPWLVRLSFEVPEELLQGLPSEERDFIMETREWYEQWNARRMQEAKEAEERAQQRGHELGLQRGHELGLQRGHELGQLQMAARLCAIRLGRPLTEAETAALAERIERLHDDRVGEVVLSFSADALVGWLADPNAS